MIPITLIIIGITILVSILAFNNDQWMRKLIMNPYLVANKNQFYRTVSSGFVHANWMHLGFNMFAFFFFGRVVESFLSDSWWEIYACICYFLSDSNCGF